jgi:citrate synthase
MADSDLRRGLEGVTAAETRLSRVDGEAGELVVAGFDVAELATRATFEETLYLLRNDELPTADELDAYRSSLAARRELPAETHDLLRAAAEGESTAMDAARIGTAAASVSREGGEDRKRDADLVVAQLPTAVAAYWRYRQDEEPVTPDPALSHAANYLYMLSGEEPAPETVRGLETYLNAVVDHGLNASTFAARVVASTESDVVSAVTAAVGALKGPLHGGAPGPVLEMIREVVDSGDPEGYVRTKLDAGERIMGFGHRVYRVRDPRAAVLQTAAERFYRERGDEAFLERAQELESVAADLLADHKPDRRLETNVEFYTAVLLNGIGIPQELFAATFGVARVGGWTAHCLEQYADNRLVRPRARYVGETGRSWTPLEDR